jgi:hypothetical protein
MGRRLQDHVWLTRATGGLWDWIDQVRFVRAEVKGAFANTKKNRIMEKIGDIVNLEAHENA